MSNTITFSDVTFEPNQDTSREIMWSYNRVTHDSSTDPHGSSADNINWFDPTSSHFSTPRVESVSFSDGSTISGIGSQIEVTVNTSTGNAKYKVAYAGYFTNTAYPNHEFLMFQIVSQESAEGNASKLNINNNYFTIVTSNSGSDKTNIPNSIQAGNITGEITYFNSLPDFNITIECYLAGTLIETAKGKVPIQELEKGESIAVYHNKKITFSKLNKLRVNTTQIKTKDDLPIIIKKDAIAENIPSQDLYVTNEHSILLDGKFYLARTLVNGTSIVIDYSYLNRKTYTTYHLEMDQHFIIKANDIWSESYLNATKQINDHIALVGHQSINDMAAPLVTAVSKVKEVWDALNKRAENLFKNNKIDRNDAILETNPDLRLELENGVLIAPFKKVDGKYVFIVSKNVKKINIISRTFRPCDVEGPYVDDRRRLGVFIGEITFNNFERTIAYTAHLEEKSKLKGWSVCEEGGRWTTGAAEVNISDVLPVTKEGFILTINVIKSGKYEILGNGHDASDFKLRVG